MGINKDAQGPEMFELAHDTFKGVRQCRLQIPSAQISNLASITSVLLNALSIKVDE